MTKEDLRDRKRLNQERSSVIIPTIKFGAESAKNFTVLKWHDIQNTLQKDNILYAQNALRFDNKQEIENKLVYYNNEVDKHNEIMEKYKELELENRKEYEKFYNGLGDNSFLKVSSDFVYGATASILDPFELVKNLSINALGNTLLPGGGVLTKFAVNTVLDTFDNLHSISWEDELLGQERPKDQALIQAVGGALISNGVFPMIKYATGRVIKGKTINPKILNADVSSAYKKSLENVDSIDLRFSDKKIVDSVYQESVKNAVTEEGTKRIFPKQIIKENAIYNRTGIRPTLIDYTSGIDRLKTMTKELKEMTNKIENPIKKNGEKKFENLALKEKASPFRFERNAQEWVKDYFQAPFDVIQDNYKQLKIKTLRELNPMFEKEMYLTLSNKGYNDVLGESIEDYGVARSVFSRMKSDFDFRYPLKSSDGFDINKTYMYGLTQQDDFVNAIKNVVSYNSIENRDLLLSDPKYTKYFSSEINNIDDVKKIISDIITDSKKGKINKAELTSLLHEYSENYYKYSPNQSFDKYINNLSIKLKRKKVYKIGDKYRVKKFYEKYDYLKEIELKDNIINKKVNVAILKLGVDKAKLLSDFAELDETETKKVLGDKIYLLKGVETENDYTKDMHKDLFHKLSSTTKDINNIKDQLKDLIGNEKYDLLDFIKEKFNGDNLNEQIENFLDFTSDYHRDNADMLNVMDKLIMNDQASMSAWGVPFKVISDVLDDKGDILDIMTQMPIIRNAFNNNKITAEDFAFDHGYKTLAPFLTNALKNFVETHAPFTPPKQATIEEQAGDFILNTTRGTLLFASGLAETFSHPILAMIKAKKYGGSTLGSIKIIPKAVIATAYETLKPIASISNRFNDLYKGLGKLIDSDEIAMMEFFLEADNLFGKGDLNLGQKIGNVALDVSLAGQHLMQGNRNIASNLVAIDKIKKMLKAKEFNNLKPDARKVLSSLGIKDNDDFMKWKNTIYNVDKKNTNKGLFKALYTDELGQQTKTLKQLIAKEIYEENPLMSVKDKARFTDFTSKIRMIFTSFNRATYSYLANNIFTTQTDTGTYISRFSKEGLKKTPKEITYGAFATLSLGLGGLAGYYLQSKALGDSKDEKIKARLSSVFDGKFDSMKRLGIDLVTTAWGLDNLVNSNGLAHMAVYDRLKEGVTKDPKKLLPPKLELVVNRITGDKDYKKYRDLNTKEKYIYDRLVLKDNRDSSIFDYLYVSALTSEKVENEEMTKQEALDIKRQYGYNDKDIIDELISNGFDTVKEYAILNADNDDELLDIFDMGIDVVGENRKEPKEIIEELDTLNEFSPDTKRFERERQKLKLTEEEKEELEIYKKALRLQGFDEIEIYTLVAKWEKERLNKR